MALKNSARPPERYVKKRMGIQSKRDAELAAIFVALQVGLLCIVLTLILLPIVGWLVG